jgi:hypothetical protein
MNDSLRVVAVLAVSDAEWDGVLSFTGHHSSVKSNNPLHIGGQDDASLVVVDDDESQQEQLREPSRSTPPISPPPPTPNTAAPPLLLVPGLGVHPWYVQDAKPDWLAKLWSLLELHPQAIVGEVGLCKCAKNLRGSKESREKHWRMQR